MPAVLTAAQLARDLAITDLTDPAEGPHAIQLVAEQSVAALASAWGCEARWCRGPRIVTVADNYDRLGYQPGAVTREARYTRYLDGRRMLRSHSTAMVPPALRRLADDPGDDVLLVCPGMVYRRDAIDWQHTGTPHQLDLWRVSRRPLGPADMEEMITELLGALAPGRRSRQEPRDHPYTSGGRQVDVAHGLGWVEVWECGPADPGVLARAGLAGRSGLALGMGLDRLLMLRKGIPDIRLLRSADQRIASQMLDLAPYRPVSARPAVRRDLSLAVDAGADDEILGGRIRDALRRRGLRGERGHPGLDRLGGSARGRGRPAWRPSRAAQPAGAHRAQAPGADADRRRSELAAGPHLCRDPPGNPPPVGHQPVSTGTARR
jgi:phenylalanyl-tRNA synthetase alpha chain